jgi:hypothetical protein
MSYDGVLVGQFAGSAPVRSHEPIDGAPRE